MLTESSLLLARPYLLSILTIRNPNEKHGFNPDPMVLKDVLQSCLDENMVETDKVLSLCHFFHEIAHLIMQTFMGGGPKNMCFFYFIFKGGNQHNLLVFSESKWTTGFTQNYINPVCRITISFDRQSLNFAEKTKTRSVDKRA